MIHVSSLVFRERWFFPAGSVPAVLKRTIIREALQLVEVQQCDSIICQGNLNSKHYWNSGLVCALSRRKMNCSASCERRKRVSTRNLDSVCSPIELPSDGIIKKSPKSANDSFSTLEGFPCSLCVWEFRCQIPPLHHECARQASMTDCSLSDPLELKRVSPSLFASSHRHTTVCQVSDVYRSHLRAWLRTDY